MTGSWVVDSSVAYKWFADEAGSAEARELLVRHRDGEISLIAPSLLKVEVANVLRYSGLPESGVLGALEALARLHLDIVEPDDALLAAACSLALEHDLTVYDALFLALAIADGSSLVSADRRFLAQIPESLCSTRLL